MPFSIQGERALRGGEGLFLMLALYHLLDEAVVGKQQATSIAKQPTLKSGLKAQGMSAVSHVLL